MRENKTKKEGGKLTKKRAFPQRSGWLKAAL
jgi:hypothetical protein